ncbi:hypothetical protein [Ottowia testudinis]|uniref:Uncharacterized protein n=1 Tax=Ottowia testudinis TaxID=2816950 RepID=A0A975CDT8_9BURK|nr:hypothetical protein [Ottowia testudinis]QTD44555.1 hypothetical protein J1M35_15860 [Ottowia testudinis]
MAIKQNASRQELIVAHLTINHNDPVIGTAENAIDLPGNAVVVGGDIVVTTPWNNVTTATLTLGDAASANRYANAVDLKTAARTALTVTGFTHALAESLKALVAQAGTAPTAGSARVTLQYYVIGRSAFTQD